MTCAMHFLLQNTLASSVCASPPAPTSQMKTSSPSSNGFSPACRMAEMWVGGVDPITRCRFWELIYQASARDITVFVTTHYMDEAEYCDWVSIMVDGKISVLDSPRNLSVDGRASCRERV